MMRHKENGSVVQSAHRCLAVFIAKTNNSFWADNINTQNDEEENRAAPLAFSQKMMVVVSA